MARIQNDEEDILSLEFARRLQAEEYAAVDLPRRAARQPRAKAAKKNTSPTMMEDDYGAEMIPNAAKNKVPHGRYGGIDADLMQQQLDDYGAAMQQDKLKVAKNKEAAQAEAAQAKAAQAKAAQAEADQAEADQAEVALAPAEALSVHELRQLRIKAFSKPTAN